MKTPNTKQTTAEVGMSMEITEKTQTTEDTITTTQGTTTSMARATKQTTEDPATAVYLQLSRVGVTTLTEQFILDTNIEAFYIFINALQAGHRFVLRKVEM